MLATSFTNLGEILSGAIAFFEFKDFIILFRFLGLAFGKSFQNVYKFPSF